MLIFRPQALVRRATLATSHTASSKPTAGLFHVFSFPVDTTDKKLKSTSIISRHSIPLLKTQTRISNHQHNATSSRPPPDKANDE